MEKREMKISVPKSMIFLMMHFLFYSHAYCGELKEKAKEYSVEPVKVQLSGVIVPRKVWGCPDCAEQPEKHEKVTVYFFILSRPIDVKGNKNDEISSMDFKNVRELEIFDTHTPLEKYLNKRVVLKGTLHEKSAGVEYTDVLFDVESVVSKK